jgi:hypothetical protein
MFAFGIQPIAFPCGSETANFASYLGLVQRNSFALSHYRSFSTGLTAQQAAGIHQSFGLYLTFGLADHEQEVAYGNQKLQLLLSCDETLIASLIKSRRP